MKPIRVIDTDFNLVTEIDKYSSAMITRSWHGIGSMELRINRHIQGASFLKKGRLLIVGSSLNKVYMILHREIELNEEGKASENWLIKGFALKAITGQRIIIPPVNQTHDSISGDAETVFKHYVNNHIINPVDAGRKIDRVVNAANQNRGEEISWKARLTNLGEDLSSLSLTTGMGWNIALDYHSKQFVFDVAEGRDLTINQRENPPVVFSPHFETIRNLQ
ncbi:siphovirus ReqiPepy6 Gp37-like family protein, partial [Bacillus infantis]|uniref:siphovirus ReqiPepy6 Gp37-like family protein n=1 Tax=Bacillus infantis TaxID=324767 RepID=UPI002FBDD1FF